MSPAVKSVSRSSFVELSDGLRQPSPLGVPALLRTASAFGGECDVHLAAVGRMRLALDHTHFLKRRDGGAHRLRLHAFRARQIGRRCSTVCAQALHDGRFG